MFKFKKVVSCALMVVLMAGAFSGCTKKDDSVVEISWYMPKAIDNVSDQELVEAEANKILMEKLGVKLKFHLIDAGNYDQKMNAIISSGESYDICFTTSYTNDYLNNVKRNAFLNIKDILDEHGQDILAKVDNRVLEAITQNGEIYAIPSQIPLTSQVSRVLKKDLVEKYNFDYKNAITLRELEPFLAQVKENESGITPILSLYGPILEDYNDDSIAGLRYSEIDKKFVKYYDIPEVIEEYRTRNDFYNKGYYAADAATVKAGTAAAKSGKYAVLPSTGYYTEDGSKAEASYGFPCAETYLETGVITTPGVMVAMNAIGVNSKHPVEAIKLLNLIWKDPDLSNLLAYGIEGIHYVVDETNTEEKSVIPKTGKEQTWAIWHNFIGPLWDQWDSPWNRTEALEEMQRINDEAEVSGVFGFIFDTDPVKTEIALISSVIQEISPILGTGSMPDFDEFMVKARQKLTEAGIDKVLEEANRQLEEWKKTK